MGEVEDGKDSAVSEGMMFNSSFYPTPSALASRMVSKIDGRPERILEPSAGKGDLVEKIWGHFEAGGCRVDISAIEVDESLQAILRGKKIKVIDSDFLNFAGPDKFDLIIMNPPFEDGDKHLLKALDVMYRGQIICLLNAETIKNPFTNFRKVLVRRLEELGAKIEYIENAFLDAERKTGVEVALVDIRIERKVEDDLFAWCDDKAKVSEEKYEEKRDVARRLNVLDLVREYNETITIGQETILGYYKNYPKVGRFLGLNSEIRQRSYSAEDLTGLMQSTLNEFLNDVRKDYWRRALDLDEVKDRLTMKKRDEFEVVMADRCSMAFTEHNIRQFVLNLIGSYKQTLTEATLEIFDMFTGKHSWKNTVWEKNIHYFNGWATNSSYKVGARVVIPIHGSYGPAFLGYSGWSLDYRAEQQLSDIDKVMSYFDAASGYVSLSKAIKEAFARGENSGESTYFLWKCHKKGTIHLTFRSADVLRRFNVVGCQGKGWLPFDYGCKDFSEMSTQERAVAESFDGRKTYEENIRKPVFALKAVPVALIGQEAE
jgi:predicted RNA methylase